MTNSLPTACEECGARGGRLTWVLPEDALETSLTAGREDVFVCDACHHRITGSPGGCQEFCCLPTNHTGVCRG